MAHRIMIDRSKVGHAVYAGPMEYPQIWPCFCCGHILIFLIHALYSPILLRVPYHYDDVIMTMLASQITSLAVVYSIVYSGVDQRKHQSSASLAFVREIHRGPVNFPQKWPVTRKIFPFDDVIMLAIGLRHDCLGANKTTLKLVDKIYRYRTTGKHNTSAPGKSGSDFKNSVSNLVWRLCIFIIIFCYNNALSRMPQVFLMIRQQNSSSGNGLVPSGNKPLPEPMMIEINVAIWRHRATRANREYVSWNATVQHLQIIFFCCEGTFIV